MVAIAVSRSNRAQQSYLPLLSAPSHHRVDVDYSSSLKQYLICNLEAESAAVVLIKS